MRHALLSLSMAYVSLASNLTMRECSCALLQVVHDSDNNLNHVDDDDDDDDEDAGCSALSKEAHVRITIPGIICYIPADFAKHQALARVHQASNPKLAESLSKIFTGLGMTSGTCRLLFSRLCSTNS